MPFRRRLRFSPEVEDHHAVRLRRQRHPRSMWMNFRAINSQNAKNVPRYRAPVETSAHPRSDGVGVGPSAHSLALAELVGTGMAES
jgi:hypothetical protein